MQILQNEYQYFESMITKRPRPNMIRYRLYTRNVNDFWLQTVASNEHSPMIYVHCSHFFGSAAMCNIYVISVRLTPLYIANSIAKCDAHGQWFARTHYDDAIMGAIASQITSLTIVYSTVYSGADQNKHQSSASLAFVWGNHRGPVNSPHKWPVTRKMFPFDDVIMWCKKVIMWWYTNNGKVTAVWIKHTNLNNSLRKMLIKQFSEAHYNDVTYVTWCLQTSVTPLFAPGLVGQTTTKTKCWRVRGPSVCHIRLNTIITTIYSKLLTHLGFDKMDTIWQTVIVGKIASTK